MCEILKKHKEQYTTHYTQGKQQEDNHFDLIKEVFNQPSLTKTRYRYSQCDYYSNRYLYSAYKYKMFYLGLIN